MKRPLFKMQMLLLIAALVVFGGSLKAQNAASRFPLIPYPKKLVEGKGLFVINAQTIIQLPANGTYSAEAGALNEVLRMNLTIKAGPRSSAKSTVIQLVNDAAITRTEGYRMQITPKRLTISANSGVGIFRAIQTIRQLLPESLEDKLQIAPKQLSLQALIIEDEPGYDWRGMHLDVSRHFFSVDYLKKFIDRLALYKFNKFHLHLTDDQGWRIEIKKYPRLTQEGAWRTFNNQDSVCMARAAENPDFIIDPQHIIQRNGKTLYGGFYTQAQMKDVVAYALARKIDIIPEIDMPGHMMAAINSYPFLTCNGENNWGELFTKPICPCNEATYEFAQNVYDEIMEIFPSKYIHIGGDEVDRTDWGKSEVCKAFMQREGIKDLAGLQSYFINRMEKYFNSKGRKLIGWDEILEGGISPTALVMYWRSWVPKAPIVAAKNGNKVIMSPGSPLYFDAKYDKNADYNVYKFNPVPKGLTDKEAEGIMGAQANIWTEYIPTEQRADYMYMPRMTALAEVLWTNDKQRDFDNYRSRLMQHYKRLDELKVNYRLPDLPDMIDTRVFTDQETLKINKPMANLLLRYTADGSQPTATSNLLNDLVITTTQKIKVAAFTPAGRRGDVYEINYQHQSLAPAATATASYNGLTATLHKGLFKQVSRISTKPDSVFSVSSIVVPQSIKAPAFAVKYSGYINVPQDDIYTFYLTCDDGGVLTVANRLTVDNDGLHSAVEKSGQVALKKGLQRFKLDFIEGGGGYTLKLQYSVKGQKAQDIPESWFKN
ncbi:family 20 glycosylhydrolase [Mucilaginibacter sp. PAMB04168]|uniref:family 20 glycosylhydrolase n=1 Tax=Mucilaginibacter sp. PAMB04168 TaxID=3138567 RepID=UPI0031F65100